MVDLEPFVRQSPYSAPGRHAERLARAAVDVASACAVSRNVLAHYRVELPDLPAERHGEVDTRWVEDVLDLDAARHPEDLAAPRAVAERVAGCCRDHSLLVVGALRQLGVPARTRVGFVDHFTPGWSNDHVVVEHWAQGAWHQVDPEFDGTGWRLRGACETWLAFRAGDLDVTRHGVFPGSDFAGERFVRDEVLYEVAHLHGDEVLLWDEWGALADPGTTDAFVDEVARLVVAADAGEEGAQAELRARYAEDDRLHVGDTVVTHSPYGAPSRVVDLAGHHQGRPRRPARVHAGTPSEEARR